MGAEFVGVAEEGKLRAYWNERTGDAEIFPLLERQKPEKAGIERSPQSERAGALAKQIFARPDILEKDSTRVLVGEPLPLLGTTANREGREGKVADSGREIYMTYVPVHRAVGDHPVYGPGSKSTSGSWQ